MIDLNVYDWAESVLTSNAPAFSADSISLRRHRRDQHKHRWELELVSVEMPERQALAMLADLQGDEECQFVHPVHATTAGTDPGDLTVAQAVNAGAKVVRLTSNSDWQLMKGELLRFGGSHKVYQVREDTVGGIGFQDVTLTSQLQQDVALSETATATDVPLRLLPEGIVSLELVASEGRFCQITTKLVEVI